MHLAPRKSSILLAVCIVTASFAQTPSTAPANAASTSDDSSIVTLNAFEVSAATDKGYRASNSVSATRINTPIADLPFAISAFTPQFITDINALDLYDVVRYSAGVTSGSTEFTSGNTTYNLRGYPQPPEHDGFSEAAFASPYVDMAGVERVEVIKGPASLLYGQVSPGGTVNYISKRPEPKPFESVTVEAGSFSFFRSAIDINRPLVPDTLLFRLNAAWQNGFQFVHPSESKTTVIDPSLTWNVTPKLALKANFQWFYRHETPPAVYLPLMDVATPQSVVNALNGATGYPSPGAALTSITTPAFALGFKDNSDPGQLDTFPGLPRGFNYDSQNDYRTTKLKTLNVEADLHITKDWVARANFDWNSHTDSQFQTGVGNFFIVPQDALAYNGATGTWSVAPSWNALSSAQQVAAELAFANSVMANHNAAYTTQNGTPAPILMARRPRLVSVFGQDRTAQIELTGAMQFPWGKLSPLIGAYYDNGVSATRVWQNLGNAASPFFRTWDVNPNSPTYFVDHNTPGSPGALTLFAADQLGYASDQAVYGLVNAKFMDDRLIAVAGARYNRSQTQPFNYLTTPAAGRGYKAHYTTPEVAVGYKATRDVMLYASFSESYALPGTTYLTNYTVVNGVPQTFPTGAAKPFLGVGYEVGLKTSLLEGRVSSTLSLYSIDQKNQITAANATINGVGVSATIQGSRTTSQGVEYEITWSPTDNWQVFASAAEDDMRIRDEPLGYEYYNGSLPMYGAKTLANLWTRYNFKGTGWWLGGGANYTSRMAEFFGNKNLFLPAYTLVNAVAGYDWKLNGAPLTATVSGQNLTNVFYVPATQVRGLPRRIEFSVTARY